MAEDLNWENAFEYERLVKLNTFFFFLHHQRVPRLAQSVYSSDGGPFCAGFKPVVVVT